ncbi:MAG TPA: YidC/Oxa1 family membrane protein insertase [bacterium]|jgi:YidC/Oxa1 family membrane protein insertase|nr:YidC/Oxa1 family membrane protein insertase [bacterium]HOQ91433.1 YidC/Oxa1 family membrane protein insertase [bacterium]HPL22270.1 YidC/Oxa1 family membrane protein insertase [bacterium]HPX64006.1 YidC/Oxa1 family membrane protein insertase [bacterium]HQA84162.1 YidC/Oxa1 family membrane protein insertase [bacterium]
MGHIFTIIFYQPVLNLLVFFYNILPGHDIGLVIVALTVAIKLILWPLSQRALKSQQVISQLQPKIKEIQNKYKDNKEEQGRAMMALYREAKVNPTSSCLPLLIQLPFLWAVFRVFRDGLSNKSLALVYPFISRPELLQTTSFGIIDLSKPNIFLAILTGLAQYFQAKTATRQTPPAAGGQAEELSSIMNKQMLYFMPVMTVAICWRLPSGLSLYWFLSSILTILQQIYWFKKHKHNN